MALIFVGMPFPSADYTISTTSLYFVRSGHINVNISFLRYASSTNFNWSSTTASTVWGTTGLGTYYLEFGTANAYPSDGPTYRWLGFPLRCLENRTFTSNKSSIHILLCYFIILLVDKAFLGSGGGN